jgi:hypothetical protein
MGDEDSTNPGTGTDGTPGLVTKTDQAVTPSSSSAAVLRGFSLLEAVYSTVPATQSQAQRTAAAVVKAKFQSLLPLLDNDCKEVRQGALKGLITLIENTTAFSKKDATAVHKEGYTPLPVVQQVSASKKEAKAPKIGANELAVKAQYAKTTDRGPESEYASAIRAARANDKKKT